MSGRMWRDRDVHVPAWLPESGKAAKPSTAARGAGGSARGARDAWDYMDEEDVSRALLSSGSLALRREFDVSGSRGLRQASDAATSLAAAGAASGSVAAMLLSGADLPPELLVGAQPSIGKSILQGHGWREGAPLTALPRSAAAGSGTSLLQAASVQREEATRKARVLHEEMEQLWRWIGAQRHAAVRGELQSVDAIVAPQGAGGRNSVGSSAHPTSSRDSDMATTRTTGSGTRVGARLAGERDTLTSGAALGDARKRRRIQFGEGALLEDADAFMNERAEQSGQRVHMSAISSGSTAAYAADDLDEDSMAVYTSRDLAQYDTSLAVSGRDIATDAARTDAVAISRGRAGAGTASGGSVLLLEDDDSYAAVHMSHLARNVALVAACLQQRDNCARASDRDSAPQWPGFVDGIYVGVKPGAAAVVPPHYLVPEVPPHFRAHHIFAPAEAPVPPPTPLLAQPAPQSVVRATAAIVPLTPTVQPAPSGSALPRGREPLHTEGRRVFAWQPVSLLCKRLDVRVPIMDTSLPPAARDVHTVPVPAPSTAPGGGTRLAAAGAGAAPPHAVPSSTALTMPSLPATNAMLAPVLSTPAPAATSLFAQLFG